MAINTFFRVFVILRSASRIGDRLNKSGKAMQAIAVVQGSEEARALPVPNHDVTMLSG